ncbi:MAG: hypothetical protein J3R72DRAFT_434961 [Linnemannia gamsii]|nr:MAG: hypothetical protein J3R72DRAFT_434961 [Linnemannia gamsii]
MFCLVLVLSTATFLYLFALYGVHLVREPRVKEEKENNQGHLHTRTTILIAHGAWHDKRMKKSSDHSATKVAITTGETKKVVH